MNSIYLQMLATTPADTSGGLLDMLGIDVWTLVFQIIAFLVLVFVLGKWVYPVFVGIIDKHEESLEASAKAADEAKKAADTAGAEVARLMKEARREAADIIATAKTEASAMIDTAEQKSKKKAETLLATAKDDIEKEMILARKQLHSEMVDLVALATEKVVTASLSDTVDRNLIKASLKEAQ